jgi:nitroreductase
MQKQLGMISFFRSLGRLLEGRPNIPPSLQDNALLNIIMNRRSIRTFKQQPIPDDVFAAILEAGRLAPCTVNLQSWTFATYDSQSWKQIFDNRPIPFKAARAIIIMGDNFRVKQTIPEFPDSPLVLYTMSVMNASLAAMNMNIAAEALGVSSVMLSETGRTGLLDVGYLKEKLSLPDHVFPIMTIVFGYPRGFHPPLPPKLPMEQIRITDKYVYPDQHIMEDWLSQMIAGYKASHLTSSFNAQLKVYQSKIDQAEADLQKLIFVDQPTPLK